MYLTITLDREPSVTDLEYLLRLRAALDNLLTNLSRFVSSSKPLRLRTLRECKERLRKNFGRGLVLFLEDFLATLLGWIVG